MLAGRGRAERFPGQPPLRAFLLGLVTGMVYFIGTIYWTGTVVAQFGQLATPVAIFAMLLLAAYLALDPAFAALLTSYLIARAGARALLFAPAAWVATEFLRGYLFGGFPWVPLGTAGVRAAGRSARERRWRLRPLGAGGVRQCRHRVRDADHRSPAVQGHRGRRRGARGNCRLGNLAHR